MTDRLQLLTAALSNASVKLPSCALLQTQPFKHVYPVLRPGLVMKLGRIKLSKVIAIARTKFIPSSWQVLIVKLYPDEHYPRNVHGRPCWQFICSRMSTITTRQHSTTKQHHDQLQFTVNRQCKYTYLRSLAGWTAYPRGRQPEEDIYIRVALGLRAQRAR